MQEPVKGAASMDSLLHLVDADMVRVNQTIMERMVSPISLIPQLAGHLIVAGGKRIRPMLTLAAAKLCDYEGDRHVKLAACVEFIHTSTLLHDDVVDESDLRRGAASANAIWGNKPSVLVGDFLFSRCFEMLVEDGSLAVLGVMSNATTVLAEGEVLQLATANDTETDEATYLQVIESKTAILFAAACRVGALAAGKEGEQEQALGRYGANLGVAFQLVDDVLDYSAKMETMGKAVGDDFREGKITLPVILAFKQGDDEEKAFWKRTLEELDQDENGEDLKRAIVLMEKHKSLEESIKRAEIYGRLAKDALAVFPDGPMKSALLDIVDFCIERVY